MTLFLVFAFILGACIALFGLFILLEEAEPVGFIMLIMGAMFFVGAMHQVEANKQAQYDYGNMVQYRSQVATLGTTVATLRSQAKTSDDRIAAAEHALAETGKQLASTRDKLDATSKVLVRTQDDLAKATAEAAVAGEQLTMCENTKAAYKVTLEEAEGKLTQIKEVLGE